MTILESSAADRIQWQLATSSVTLLDRISVVTGDPYEIVSLALPLGMNLSDETLLRSGSFEGHSYEFSGAAAVAGGLTVSPFASDFGEYAVDRALAIDGCLEGVFEKLFARKNLVFVSDGDPDLIIVPTEATLDVEQRDRFTVPAGWANERIVRYDRT